MLNRAWVMAGVVASTSVVASASVLSDWNVIVRTNVSSSSEVDGSTLIGGNLVGTSNYTVQGVTNPNGVGLAVGGNVSGGTISVNNGGNFRFNGTVSSIINLSGGNSALDPTIPAQVASAFSQVATISSSLALLAANGTLDNAGNLNAVPTNLGGQLVAVYNLTPSQWSSLGQLNLNFGAASSVIINVLTPGSVSFVAPPNLLGGFSQANSSRILWNIPNATSVTVGNSFNGAIIAPNADLKVLSGAINGTVVVNSISQQISEIRRSTYTGYIPAPGTMSLLGLAGLVAMRRRR